ncbi:hypothetical protein FHG87_008531 [Trinorchestia longiramus]|nr:hypothetical protein FHG87_008531 [Trinorchestia longiramus]
MVDAARNTAWDLGHVEDHTLNSSQLNSHALTSSQLNSHALTSSQLNSHELTSSQLNSHALTSSQLNSHALTSSQLNSHALNSSQLNSHALTSSQLNFHALTSSQLNSGCRVQRNPEGQLGLLERLLVSEGGVREHTASVVLRIMMLSLQHKINPYVNSPQSSSSRAALNASVNHDGSSAGFDERYLAKFTLKNATNFLVWCKGRLITARQFVGRPTEAFSARLLGSAITATVI